MDAARRQLWLYGGAICLGVCWCAAFYSVWNSMRLFSWIGVDYALLGAAAEVLTAEPPEAAYDLEVVARHLEPYHAYYRDLNIALRNCPIPHLPVTFLLYAPFLPFSPSWGFALWAAVNLLLAGSVVRDLAARFPKDQFWPVAALGLMFFPLTFALWVGQPVVVMLFAFHRAYLNWERGRDFEAGLWCGLLFLKVQYLPFLVLVLTFKRRWRSLAGMAATIALLGLSSIALLGSRGLTAYLATLRSVSGFREVNVWICPEQMICWRALLVHFLPGGVSESSGKALILLLAAATTSTLLVIWRGPWNPQDARFPMKMLAVLLVTMLATFHNHIHGAVPLLVPGMVLLAQGGGPAPLPMLLRLGLFAPIMLFAINHPLPPVSLLFLGLMATTLGLICWTIGSEDAARAVATRRPVYAEHEVPV